MKDVVSFFAKQFLSVTSMVIKYVKFKKCYGKDV